MKTRMDYELRRRWLEALRSDNFRQCKQVLKTEDGALCVCGVLCQVSDEGKYDIKGKFVFREEIYDIEAPTEFLNITTQCRLIKMNDEQDKTFLELADYIEENIEGV